MRAGEAAVSTGRGMGELRAGWAKRAVELEEFARLAGPEERERLLRAARILRDPGRDWRLDHGCAR